MQLRNSKDIRDAFFDEIYNIVKEDKNYIVLVCDASAFSLEKLKKDFPQQYINMGTSEQNAIGVAAGLAKMGKRVLVYAVTPFLAHRALEQIKVDLCYHNLPVTVVGMGTGFTYGTDGPTHYATEDISAINSLPEIAIYNPNDNISAAKVARWSYENNGPVYVRMEKGKYPDIHMDFNDGIEEYGYGSIAIITTGVIAHKVLEIAGDRNVKVVDIIKLKPLPEDSIEAVLKNIKNIITVEEHVLTGGLGSIIANLVVDKKIPVNVKRIGFPVKRFLECRSRDSMLRNYKLDNKGIIKEIENVVDR